MIMTLRTKTARQATAFRGVSRRVKFTPYITGMPYFSDAVRVVEE